jgi:hypothetical protein
MTTARLALRHVSSHSAESEQGKPSEAPEFRSVEAATELARV